MSQQPTLFCPKCHTPAVVGQRFCAQCGASIETSGQTATVSPAYSDPSTPTSSDDPYKPTVLSSNPYNSSPTHENNPYSVTPPPPPPPNVSLHNTHTSSPQLQYPAPGGFQAPPPIAQKDSTKSVLGQIGCGFLVALLLILAVCGGASYWAYVSISAWMNEQTSTINNQYGNNTTPQSSTSTSSTETTKTNNAVKTTTFATKPPKFTYADVLVTINSVKQAETFADDNYTTEPGILRLEVKLENKHSGTAYLDGVMSLVLPDSTTVNALRSKESLFLSGGIVQFNWIDFQVPTSVDVSKVTLRVGKAELESLDIPLVDNADLSKYEPISIKPNKTVQYKEVNWTAVEAHKQLSYKGQQAKKGNVFIVVDLRVSNPSSDTFIAYYGDYLRLKSGETVVATDTTTDIPTSFSPGQTNVKGVAVFEIESSSKEFSLWFIDKKDGAKPVSAIDMSF